MTKTSQIREALPRRFIALLTTLLAVLTLAGASPEARGQSYSWTNFAGVPGGQGNTNGMGSAARFFNPSGVAVDGSGNVYVADKDNNTIRKITSAGVVTTLAGSAGVIGSTGSTDGTGSAARFYQPTGVAVDASGNVYVADQANNTIRKVTTAGVVTTLAGSAGAIGSTDGTGSAARFNQPTGVAVDASGNVYVADQTNNTIRKVTSAGVVTTLAGSAGASGSADGAGSAARFNQPSGVAVDGSGNVYVADQGNDTIRKVTSAGVVTTLAGSAGNAGSADGTGSAARFDNPIGVVVDGGGNIYVVDQYNNTIRKITSTGVVTTLAGSAGSAGSADGTGSAARFAGPAGVTVDGSGNVFVADPGNQTIRKITNAGVVTTLAGSPYGDGSADGTGNAARFENPTGVAVDGGGTVYVADEYNDTIRKITSAGVVTTLAGFLGGSTDGTGSAASFNFPSGLAVDGSGNVYVADSENDTIRKITSAGVVTTLAGSAGVVGSADGTGSVARFYQPQGVAVDGSGNVYVADQSNQTIRKITSAGVVTTLAGSAGSFGYTDGTGSAARFYNPTGVAVDGGGTVYVADTNNHTIRKITGTGVVTTLAGSAGSAGNTDGTGAAARFFSPTGVAVDGSGNVFVADPDNQTIRKIASAGVVTTIGGTAGVVGGADGLGSAAQFSSPYGIAVSDAGNLFAADSNNNRITQGTSQGGAPALTLSIATNLTTTSATLNGTVNPQGVATTAQFQYGLTTSYGSTAGVTLSPNNGTTNQIVSAALTGLTHSTLYHYRLTATNSGGTSTTTDGTFTTLVQPPPVVTLGAAGSIATTSATLNGTVNPQGAATTAQFQYGLTTSYGSTASVTLSPNNGTTNQSVSAALTGLTPNTLYHYRLTATNSGGAGTTTDGTFSPLPLPPTLTVAAATAISANGATLTGTANPNGGATTAQFEYGLTSSYGSTASITLSPNNGTSAQTVSAAVSPLMPSTLYHYRLSATNAGGTSTTSDGTFTTMVGPGGLDTNFGSGGKVTTQLSSGNDVANGVVVQNDGKIVVAGSYQYGASASQLHTAVVRYTAAGALDTTFAGTGVSGVSVGINIDEAMAVALQSDGKIVTAGQADYDFAVVRLTAAGALDSSFGGTGEVLTHFGNTLDGSYATSLAVQNDGKIVVAGYTDDSVDKKFAVARYTATGALDSTFGGGTGKVITNIGGVDDSAFAVAVQSDNKIVVAGYSTSATDLNIAVVRYTAAGALDTSFGGTGKITVSVGIFSRGSGVAVQSDGKIVVAGVSYAGSNVDFALVRLTSAGALDTTFGSGGKVTTPIGSGDDYGQSVAVQGDGKIVVAGYSYNGSNNDFALVRYNGNGTLDSGFGSGGMLTTAIGSNDDYGQSVAVQGDGKIVVAGYSSNGADNDFALVRYVGAPATQPATLYFTEGTKIRTLVPPGSPANFVTSGLSSPDGIAWDGGDNLYVPDFSANKVLRVTLGGAVSTFATVTQPHGIGRDAAGNLYVASGANGGSNSVVKITPGGVTSTLATVPTYIDGLAVDGWGTVYLAQNVAGRIAKVTQDGTVATLCNFAGPEGAICVDAAGNIFFGGQPTIYKVTQAGVLSVFATPSGTNIQPYAMTLDNAGNLFFADINGGRIFEVTAVGNSSVVASGLSAPTGIVSVALPAPTLPVAVTGIASSITSNSATVSGTVTANYASTSVSFEYGPTTGYGSSAPGTPSSVSGGTAMGVTANLTGLSPNTTYHFRAKAVNSAGTTYGDDATFTTAPPPPAVALGTVSGLTATGGTLNGTVNPNGTATTAQFQYGLTISYGSPANVTLSPNNGTSAQNVSAALAGLTPDTLYHYRLSATNPGGTSNTSDGTFTTTAGPPTVTLSTANGITPTGATLPGAVNPNGLATTAQFEYGATTGYGNTATVTLSPNNGTIVQNVSTTLAGLLPNTLYHYRLTATNSAGTTITSDGTFTTSSIMGGLDMSFGTGGKVTTQIGSGDDVGRSVAVQGDGKMLVAGYTFNGSDYDFALVRYTAAGALDTTFGSGGKVTTPIGSGDDKGNSVAIQSDGKIVVAGFSNSDFALVRYTSSGALDTTFGSGGKVTTPIGSGDDEGNSVAIQNDGKIVVAGYSLNGSNYDFALVRYTSSGALDTTFGTGGKVTTPIGSSSDFCQSVALQGDGKILVAGYFSNPSNDFALVRYTTSGALDTTFGNGGKVTTSIGSHADDGYSVAVQSDGKIIVAGYSDVGSLGDFALVRYTAAGALDTTFGNGGKVTTPIGSSGSDIGYSVAVQSDGKIVVAGSSLNGSNDDFALVRYTASGALDTTFGIGGKVTTPIGSSDDIGYGVAVQSDGMIVVAGTSYNGSNNDFALVRYVGAPATQPATLYFTEGTKIRTLVPPGSPANFVTSGLSSPDGIAWDGGDNLYVPDFSANKVLRVTLGGAVSTFATVTQPHGIGRDAAGNLYVASGANGGSNSVVKITPGGVTSTLATVPTYIDGLAVDGWGTVYLAQNVAGRIAKVTQDGTVATLCNFAGPEGAICVDAAGNIFFGGQPTIYKVTQAGVLSVFATPSGTNIQPYAMTLDNAGNLFFADINGGRIFEVTAVGNSSVVASGLSAPTGIVSVALPAPTLPVAVTGIASSITSNSATVSGTVTANYASTSVSFEYGPTTGYGSSAPGTPSSVSGGTAMGVTANLTGLSPNTTYHFRAKAVNSAGTTYGDDATFTTAPPPPAVALGTVSGLTATGGTLNGTVNPNGTATTAQFQYGLTISYGSTASVTLSPNNGSSAQSVSAALTGLSPGTLYHFRLTATNSGGTTNTADGTFTTLTPQEDWRRIYFGTTSNSGNAADDADPNNNGIKNLLEYALGGDPLGNTTGVGILPQVGISPAGTLQIAFTRYLDRSDITLTVLAADSPAGPWTPLVRSTAGGAFVILAPGATAPESGTGNARSVTATDLYLVTDPAHPRRYLKLEVDR